MGITKTYLSLFAFLITTVTFSCKKIKAQRIAGEYSCAAEYHYYDILPTYIDCTWTEAIMVEQIGKSIAIFNREIPVDCLKTNQYYKLYTNQNSYFNVKYYRDSIYCSYGGSGHGGASSTFYQCRKNE